MDDLLEDAGWGGAHLLRRAVGADEFGEAGLDLLVAALQGVVIGIRNLGRILAVIERVVMSEFLRQMLQLGGSLFQGEIFNGGRHGGDSSNAGVVLEQNGVMGRGRWCAVA